MSRNKLRVKMSLLKWNEVHTLNVGADKTLEIKSNSFIFFSAGFFVTSFYKTMANVQTATNMYVSYEFVMFFEYWFLTFTWTLEGDTRLCWLTPWLLLALACMMRL